MRSLLGEDVLLCVIVQNKQTERIRESLYSIVFKRMPSILAWYMRVGKLKLTEVRGE